MSKELTKMLDSDVPFLKGAFKDWAEMIERKLKKKEKQKFPLSVGELARQYREIEKRLQKIEAVLAGAKIPVPVDKVVDAEGYDFDPTAKKRAFVRLAKAVKDCWRCYPSDEMVKLKIPKKQYEEFCAAANAINPEWLEDDDNDNG